MKIMPVFTMNSNQQPAPKMKQQSFGCEYCKGISHFFPDAKSESIKKPLSALIDNLSLFLGISHSDAAEKTLNQLQASPLIRVNEVRSKIENNDSRICDWLKSALLH